MDHPVHYLEVVERRAARAPVPHLDEIIVSAADEELLARHAPVHARHPPLVRRELAPDDYALLGPWVIESAAANKSNLRPTSKIFNVEYLKVALNNK